MTVLFVIVMATLEYDTRMVNCSRPNELLLSSPMYTSKWFSNNFLTNPILAGSRFV